MEDERKESKFMKEWKESYASQVGQTWRYMSENEVCTRLNVLAGIIDKHLIEIEEDIERSFLQETLDQRLRRKGTGF